MEHAGLGEAHLRRDLQEHAQGLGAENPGEAQSVCDALMLRLIGWHHVPGELGWGLHSVGRVHRVPRAAAAGAARVSRGAPQAAAVSGGVSSRCGGLGLWPIIHPLALSVQAPLVAGTVGEEARGTLRRGRPACPVVLGVAAFIARMRSTATARAQEWLLEWKDVEVAKPDGARSSASTAVGLTRSTARISTAVVQPATGKRICKAPQLNITRQLARKRSQ